MEDRGLVDPLGGDVLSEGIVRPGILARNGLTYVVAGPRDTLDRTSVALSVLATKDELVFDIEAIAGVTRGEEIGGLLLRVGDESFASVSGIPTRVHNLTLELHEDGGRFSGYRRPGSNGLASGQIGPDVEFEMGGADPSGSLSAWNQHERLARSLAVGLSRLAQPKRHRSSARASTGKAA